MGRRFANGSDTTDAGRSKDNAEKTMLSKDNMMNAVHLDYMHTI